MAQRLRASEAASLRRAPSWAQLWTSPTSPTSSTRTWRPSIVQVSRQMPPTTMLLRAGVPALPRRLRALGSGGMAATSPRMTCTSSKSKGPTMLSRRWLTTWWAT